MVIATVHVRKREISRIIGLLRNVSESLFLRLDDPGVLGKPLRKLFVA